MPCMMPCQHLARMPCTMPCTMPCMMPCQHLARSWSNVVLLKCDYPISRPPLFPDQNPNLLIHRTLLGQEGSVHLYRGGTQILHRAKHHDTDVPLSITIQTCHSSIHTQCARHALVYSHTMCTACGHPFTHNVHGMRSSIHTQYAWHAACCKSASLASPASPTALTTHHGSWHLIVHRTLAYKSHT